MWTRWVTVIKASEKDESGAAEEQDTRLHVVETDKPTEVLTVQVDKTQMRHVQ